jgi:hypothetical protein
LGTSDALPNTVAVIDVTLGNPADGQRMGPEKLCSLHILKRESWSWLNDRIGSQRY